MNYEWKLARRTLRLGERTLLMGVLNVTPDSFSDGGQFYGAERALERARELVAEGADIIDVGGESTRPGAEPVTAEEELRRIVPVVEYLASHTEAVISVDTTKAEVARAGLLSGAEIINDISALRFDFHIADEVGKAGAGLVLMHSRGTPATMHRLPPVPDILEEVTHSLRSSIRMAERRGVPTHAIVLDPGVGFGKSAEQNVLLIARLDELSSRLPAFPILIGTSRKSFIGRLLEDAPVSERTYGTMATVTAAVLNGAQIVRVHDVRAARETVRVADAIKRAREI
jgi:dihydropteroate synthase